VATLALQVLTGTVMAFAYQPSPGDAYASTYYIANVMEYGWIVRTVHHWGASLIVVFVVLHAVLALLATRNGSRRWTTWALGALGLVAIVASAFVGGLLPWDRSALADTAAGLALLDRIPLLGDPLVGLLTGGEGLGAVALSRFYALHIAIVPGVIAVAILLHLRIARRERAERGIEVVPIYPDLLVSASTTLALLLSVYAVLAILVPAPLDVRGDPETAVERAEPGLHFILPWR
jgi:quinol-cytochrome oxidoreductase complex cytochrome b subunit